MTEQQPVGYLVATRVADGTWITDTIGLWPTVDAAEEDRFNAEADTGDDYQVMAVVPVTDQEGK